MTVSSGITLAAMLTLLGLIPAVVSARAEYTHLIWDNYPLRVALPVERERSVRFPAFIREVRIPDKLDELLRTQVVGDSIHWRATAAFGDERIIVQTVDQQSYLLDLAAVPGSAGEPIQISLSAESAATGSTGSDGLPAPLKLVRYAARYFFSPPRLRLSDSAVRSLNIRRSPPHLPLIQGTRLASEILGMWQGYGYFLTAVGLRNLSPMAVSLAAGEFDHRRIRGDWVVSGFQHSDMAAAGSSGAEDTTVLYLVSRQPFHRSLPDILQ